MSRVDENGVRHPTDSDLWDTRSQSHLAYCRECSPYAMSTVGSDQLAALIYKVRWVKGIRDASLVTDSEIAKAILEQFTVAVK